MQYLKLVSRALIASFAGIGVCQIQASSQDVQGSIPELTQEQKKDYQSTLYELWGSSINARGHLSSEDKESIGKPYSEIWIDLNQGTTWYGLTRLQLIQQVILNVKKVENNKALVNWIRSQDVGANFFYNIHSLDNLTFLIDEAANAQRDGLRETMSIQSDKLFHTHLALQNVTDLSKILLSRLGFQIGTDEFDFKNGLLPYLPARLDKYLSSSDSSSPVSTEDENH